MHLKQGNVFSIMAVRCPRLAESQKAKNVASFTAKYFQNLKCFFSGYSVIFTPDSNVIGESSRALSGLCLSVSFRLVRFTEKLQYK